jgi:hypothetical protein
VIAAASVWLRPRLSIKVLSLSHRQFLRILEAEVHQHVVDALGILAFATHHVLPLASLRASTAFKRFSIRSTSGRGVAMPDLDFF